jgi:hypothetical protein
VIEHIGVTATRAGLSPAQKQLGGWVLQGLRDLQGARTLHHGDCIGGDAEVAEIARALGFRLISHPCNLDAYRAFVDSDEELPAKDPTERNHDIVDACGYLLGFSPAEQEIQRSGTWQTIRYARRLGRPRWVIGPSGVEIERQQVPGAGGVS